MSECYEEFYKCLKKHCIDYSINIPEATGGDYKTVVDLKIAFCKLSKRINFFNVQACNRNLTKFEKEKYESLINEAKNLMKALKLEGSIQTEPRGFTIRITNFTNKYGEMKTNNWGGNFGI